MKKINLLLSVFSILLFVACSDVEPLDPALSGGTSNNNNNNGGSNGGSGGSGSGGSGSGSGGGGTSSGDYWPATVGNWWVLEQDASTTNSMEMVGTDVFSGATYYRFEPQSGSGTTVFGTATNWLNKNSGVYKIKTDDIILDAGGLSGTQTGYEFILLKDFLSIDETWSGVYTQTTEYDGVPPITQTVNYVGKIIDINASETVNSVLYDNIIKVEMTQSIEVDGIPPTEIVSEYWFSRDVGPIKASVSGIGTFNENILVDYYVQ